MTIDPVRAASPEEIEVVRNVHATLVERGADGTYVPALAVKIVLPQPGAPVLSLTLSEDLSFHGGAPLRAAEVKASLARLLSFRPELARLPGAQALSSARVTSALTIEIDVPGGAADLLLSLLADPMASITFVPPGQKDGPVDGAGPFRVKEIVGGRIRLVPFLRHFRGRPYLNALTIDSVTDPAEQRRTMQGSGWDVIDLPATAEPASRTGVVSLGEETVLVRANPAKSSNAMALLPILDRVDRQAMVDVILKGRGSPAVNLLSERIFPLATPVRAMTPPAPEPATHLELIYPAHDTDLALAAERVKFEAKGYLVVDTVPLPLDRFAERVAKGEYACALSTAFFEARGLAVQVVRELGAEVPALPASTPVDEAKIVTAWIGGAPARLYLFHRPRRILVRDGLRGMTTSTGQTPRYDDVWRDHTP